MADPALDGDEVVLTLASITQPQLPTRRRKCRLCRTLLVEIVHDGIEFLQVAQVDFRGNSELAMRKIQGVVRKNVLSPAKRSKAALHGGPNDSSTVVDGYVDVVERRGVSRSLRRPDIWNRHPREKRESFAVVAVRRMSRKTGRDDILCLVRCVIGNSDGADTNAISRGCLVDDPVGSLVREQSEYTERSTYLDVVTSFKAGRGIEIGAGVSSRVVRTGSASAGAGAGSGSGYAIGSGSSV